MVPSSILAKVRAVSLRLRLTRALRAGGLWSVALGAAWLGALLAHKLHLIDAPTYAAAWRWGLGSFAIPLGWGLLRPVGTVAAARLIDVRYGLQDRTASAVQFAAMASADQTPFMGAAIEDAAGKVVEVRGREVVPIRLPADLVPAALLAAAIAVLSFYSFPKPRRVQVAPPPIAAIEVDLDDLDAYREYARSLAERARAEDQPRLAEAAQAMNRLIEDIAARRIDREEAFRRLSELESRYLRSPEGNREELERQLREMANDLARSNLTKETSEALRTPDLRQAADAMKKLASSLREKRPSQRELDRVREALARAAREEQNPERQRELQKRRDEMQRLLQKQREKTANERERRLLQKRQRELQRLERNEEQREQARRNLERLRREMQQAAEQMNNSPQEGAGAEELEQAAEDMNRMAQEQGESEEMQRLMQRLQEMRQMMRQQQQGRGGQKMAGRLKKFYRLARGGQGGQRMRLEMGQGREGQQQGQGQGQQGQGQQGQQGQTGQGQEGQGQEGQGQGQDGQGQQVLRLSQDGQGDGMLMLPGMQPGQGPGQGSQQPGPGIGTQHDPRLQGQSTDLSSRTQDTQVSGQQGEGPSRSQVIMGAADRGFASRGYRQVYDAYQRVAEEDLDTQQVPPGYRFQIRTYFDRIRPQD